MRYTMALVLGVVLLSQAGTLAAKTCNREEIRAMIFDGASMRQVEESCSNARDAFSRPLPERSPESAAGPVPQREPAVELPVPPDSATVPAEVSPASVAESLPQDSDAVASGTDQLSDAQAVDPEVAVAAEAPPPPDPFDDPYIVAVATPATLSTSNWRSRIPRSVDESTVLTPIDSPDISANEQAAAVPIKASASETLAEVPVADSQSLASDSLPPMQSTATAAPAMADVPVKQVAPEVVPAEVVPAEVVPAEVVPAVPSPRVPVVANDDSYPHLRGEVPVADLSAVAPTSGAPVVPAASSSDNLFSSHERDMPVAATATTTGTGGSCPETSLWWSGGPSSSMAYIDICSIQLSLGELDRYYELVPFAGLNATTERRFDEDRNGISDKGIRVGDTIYWGGRDCSDGVVRIQRNQCDAVDKSGCAVVSLQLRARPGQAPTRLTLRPTFYLLFPNGSRLPSEGKDQVLNYQGCNG